MRHKMDITIDTTEIQRITREYSANELEILEEMNKFQDTYDLPKLKQEDIQNQNRLITSN
jgi:hypothetical protein